MLSSENEGMYLSCAIASGIQTRVWAIVTQNAEASDSLGSPSRAKAASPRTAKWET